MFSQVGVLSVQLVRWRVAERMGQEMGRRGSRPTRITLSSAVGGQTGSKSNPELEGAGRAGLEGDDAPYAVGLESPEGPLARPIRSCQVSFAGAGCLTRRPIVPSKIDGEADGSS